MKYRGVARCEETLPARGSRALRAPACGSPRGPSSAGAHPDATRERDRRRSEKTAAWHGAKKPFLLEDRERFAHRRAAHPEGLHQLALIQTQLVSGIVEDRKRPRRGTVRRNPSCSRIESASRTGVRLTPRAFISWRSSRRNS